MRPQFARHARRASSALLVALFAALLFVPASSQHSSVNSAGVHPAVQLVRHASDAALVSHTARPATGHHAASGAAIDADAASYPQPISSLAERNSAAGNAWRPPATFRARAPPADTSA